MKKKFSKKKAVLIGVAALSISSLVGCGTVRDNGLHADDDATQMQDRNDLMQDQNDLAGTISLSGSTSMKKLADALCESFMEKYPNVTASVEYTGSGAGIEAVIEGQSDIGNSSRNLKEEEISNGAVENIVAIDGIAVIVDKNNRVTDLTKEQLISIYTGSINNWSKVGGENTPIVVIGREAGSGTRKAFEEILEVEEQCAYVNELDSTGAIMAKVATIPGAIGYVSMDIVDDSVSTLSLDGVEATAEKIKAGEYLLSRPYIMATKGEISKQSELVQEWFHFVLGEEGQKVTSQVGLITVE